MSLTRRRLILGSAGVLATAVTAGCTSAGATTTVAATLPSTSAASAKLPSATSGTTTAAVAPSYPPLLSGPAASLPTPPIPASSLPRLASVPNFRDVAGGRASYAGAGGRPLRTGMFFRSNALTLTSQDSATLTRLGVRQIYDLRMPSQIAKQKDVVPAGAHWQNVSLFGNSLKLPKMTSENQIQSHMNAMYQALVDDPTCQQAMATLLKDIAAAEGPVLFHCSQGKDRTGWTAAVLQGVADVAPADMMTNYLLTNSYTASEIQHQADAVADDYGDAVAADYLPILGADSAMLQAAWDVLDHKYGGLKKWLTATLGLQTAVLETLRTKLLT